MVKFLNICPVIFLILFYACDVYYIGTEACDGYKIKINKLSACDGITNVFKLSTVKAQLTSDCLVDANGCVEITKQFGKCKLIYDVKKRGMMVPFKGEKDVCEEMMKASKNPEAAAKLKKHNLDPSCPVKKQKLCVPDDDKMNITNYKDKFRLAAGQYAGVIIFDCDCGKSCYKFDMEFKRGK